ncbi:MAG: VWA domain-containing protein [Acidobacteria bacterium]|nr:MAG: VWA domain-containing protein [Acidobacteriota bacterium]
MARTTTTARTSTGLRALAGSGVLLALWLLLVAPAGAQEGGEERFGGEITVTEVLLDVVVTGRDGEPVPGLTADDFLVLEDGVAVEITGLTFNSYRRYRDGDRPAAVYEPGIDALAVPQPRYFVLFFHDLMRPDYVTLGLTAQQSIATQICRDWLRRDLAPGDYVAVASFDSRLKIQQDFTRDLVALDQALRDVMMRRDPERRRPRARQAKAPAAILDALPAGRELRDRTPSVGAALILLAGALGRIDSRKSLLYHGVGIGLGPAVADALARGNVDVYALDVTPLHAEHLQQVSLRTLARDTDGFFYRGVFPNALRDVQRRASDYYQISYRRDPQAPPAVGEIEVQVRDPRLEVRYSRRYRAR